MDSDHTEVKNSFNTQPHGGGCFDVTPYALNTFVSTHSRTEAAANTFSPTKSTRNCFNTQPHGGGCLSLLIPLH